MSTAGTLQGDDLEAAAQLAFLRAVLAPVWKGARRWTAAIVLAAFPWLFLVGRWMHLPLSPVLPGLLVLAVLIVVLPFVLAEVGARRYRRHDGDWQVGHAIRAVQVANAALLIAAIWLVLWFAVLT
jgi:hypothetical protein